MSHSGPWSRAGPAGTREQGPAEPRSYTLGPAIGRGSFGSVYRARLSTGTGFQKEVAVKVLDREADEALLARLRDEARLLGLLKHRAIVGVDDLARIDGRWAVVMEYVEGVDLARLASEGPLPPAVACEIGREIALALDAAHRAVHPDTGRPLRVVHRDIKTSNVRITPQGEVKVLDFGIATARFDSREAKTQKALKFGTPGYMAPERFLGQAEPGSDVFALGALLFRILTCRKMPPLPPIPSGFANTRRAALAQLPPGAAALGPLLEQMLAFDVEDRPSAADVAADLRRLAVTFEGPWLEEWAAAHVGKLSADGPPPSAEAPTTDILPEAEPPARRPRRRGRLITWVVFTLLAVGVGLLAIELVLVIALLWAAW